MSESEWKHLSNEVEQQTPLSQRQAEVFVLNRLGGYARDEIATELGITPTTVGRHLDEADAKVKQARTLARSSEFALYHETQGEAESPAYTARVFRTAWVLDRAESHPSCAQYRLELIQNTHTGSDHGYRHQSRDEYCFDDPDAIISAIQSEEFPHDFEAVACVYTALTEAFESSGLLPPFSAIYPNTPSEEEIEAVVSSGLMSFKDIESYCEAESAVDYSLGTQVGTDIEVPFNLLNGRFTCVAGDLGTGRDVSVMSLVHRMRNSTDNAPAVVFLDPFEPSSRRSYTQSTDGMQYTYEELKSNATTLDVHEITHIDLSAHTQSLSAPMHDMVLTVLDRAKQTETRICLVIDGAFQLADQTLIDLMEAADDPDHPLQTWVGGWGTLADIERLRETVDLSHKRDGFVLHRSSSCAGLSDWLAPDQREFIYRANTKTDTQALVSPPNRQGWLPIERDLPDEEYNHFM